MAKKRKVYVNVYLLDKAYGGSEEGGWYYNTQEVIKSVGMFSRRKAKALKAKFEEDYSNVGRPSIHSVRSIGQYSVEIEDSEAKSTPEYRPHYE